MKIEAEMVSTYITSFNLGWALRARLTGPRLDVIPPSQVILLALVQETSAGNRAFATGILVALAFVFESIGSIVVGMIGNPLGLGFALAASAVLLILSLPVLLLLPEGGATHTRSQHP